MRIYYVSREDLVIRAGCHDRIKTGICALPRMPRIPVPSPGVFLGGGISFVKGVLHDGLDEIDG